MIILVSMLLVSWSRAQNFHYVESLEEIVVDDINKKEIGRSDEDLDRNSVTTAMTTESSTSDDYIEAYDDVDPGTGDNSEDESEYQDYEDEVELPDDYTLLSGTQD